MANSLMVIFITDRMTELEQEVKPRTKEVQMRLAFPECYSGNINFCYPSCDKVLVTERLAENLVSFLLVSFL
jgi:hypothetical protein